jgi:multiple sugar transport system substrate-binding protein
MSALMYNETALAAAGKPVPDEGFSWDSFASYAVALQKKLPSNVWVIDAGYSSFWFDVYARQQNKEEWTADGKIGYTKDQVLDWFNYWYDLQKAGVLVPPGKAPNAASGSPADSPFALGFTVMAAEWTNLFPTDVDANKNKLNMTRTPTGGPHVGDSVNATMQWCIAANSANTDLALAFTSFLLHDPKAIKVIGLDRGVPGNEAARKLLKPTLKPAEKLEVDFLDKYGPMSRPSTVQAPAYTGEITDAMTQAGDSMTLGKATPAQASSVFWDAAQKAAAS